MIEYAVIDGGQIVRRKYYDISGWPETKRSALDEKGDGGFVYRPVEYYGSGPSETISIEANRVLITRTTPEAPAPQEAPDLPISTLVNIERDRRINLGVLHNGKVFQSDAVSKQRLLGVVVQATLAIMNGAQANDLRWSDPNNDFTYISADNTAVPFDAPGIIALGQAVAAHERNLIYKARALKDQPGGPPADYADDSHWT